MILYIWRHPKPYAIEGICVGQQDVAVDRRKIKRLANRIQQFVKRHNLPKVVWVSPLSRSKQVGQLLAARGFDCYIDSDLMETNFGSWQGKPWTHIDKREIDAWCLDFANFTPEGGENLVQLFQRVSCWISKRHQDQQQLNTKYTSQMPILIIGHAGWISTAKMIHAGQSVATNAATWPKSVAYGELTVLNFA